MFWHNKNCFNEAMQNINQQNTSDEQNWTIIVVSITDTHQLYSRMQCS
jgi:hypothetical protein